MDGKQTCFTVGLPSMPELLAASGLLHAFPDLAQGSAAEELAVTEYAFYSTQTYLFEVVGFQLLGEMAAKLRSFGFVHTLAEQAADEAMHARAYRDVVHQLPVQLLPGSLDVHGEPIYDSFVTQGTLEEKVVIAFFVLESIAVGIFAARQRFYRSSPIAALDRRIAQDEAQHQASGIAIVAELVRDGRLTVDAVIEVIRSAASRASRVLLPTPLFTRFGVAGSRADQERVLASGFLASQRVISQRAVLNALRRLRAAVGPASDLDSALTRLRKPPGEDYPRRALVRPALILE